MICSPKKKKKKIPYNAEHHQKVCLKQSSFLFSNKISYYYAWIIASRKPQDVHSGTRNLFREVTSQGNGWFSMWELTLKIMRLFSLKLLILWETGIKDHQDSMTCWKQIFIRKSVLIQFYGMIGCGNVMPGIVCYYIYMRLDW